MFSLNLHLAASIRKHTVCTLNRRLRWKRGVLLLILLGASGLSAQDPDGTEETVFELSELEVTPSADASAGGLRPAYAGGQVASGGRVGILGSLDYMETPFVLTSYTSELIVDQQAASVGEVLLNDPAARVARGFGNFQQLYMVRGLPIYSDDMAYNGLYGLLPRQYLGTELIERVELLRGANAFLNGAAPGGSGLGGAVNIMPKRARIDPLAKFTAGVQSGGQSYFAVDLGRRFDENRFGLRFNAARRDGDTAIDGESSELGLTALGADFRGERLRISADLGYQDLQRDGAQPSITISDGLAIPAVPDASRSVAQEWTYSDSRDLFGTLRAEFDFVDGLTGWVAAGGRTSEEDNSFANPTVVDASGGTTSNRFDNVREDTVATGEFGLRANFAAGGVEHRLTASAAAFAMDSSNAYAFSDFAGFANNLYAPTAVAPPSTDFFVGGSMDNPRRTEKVRTSSFALADMFSLFDERLLLTAGLRYQEIESYSYDYNTGDELSAYSKSATTPVGGLLYKLTPRVSAFFNYIEGLTPGDVAPANVAGTPVANAGEVLEPYTTEQVELGVKLDLGRLGGSISVFQSEKPISGLDSDRNFGVIDDQRNRGLELSVYGEPLVGLKLLGGISLLDTEIGGGGGEAIGSPTTQLNLGTDWEIPGIEGLSLDGRVLYTSSQYADAAHSQEVPSWTRFDLGARYLLPLGGDTLTLRARVENVADEDYWASAGGYPGAGYLTIGAPRTVIVSATYSF